MTMRGGQRTSPCESPDSIVLGSHDAEDRLSVWEETHICSPEKGSLRQWVWDMMDLRHRKCPTHRHFIWKVTH